MSSARPQPRCLFFPPLRALKKNPLLYYTFPAVLSVFLFPPRSYFLSLEGVVLFFSLSIFARPLAKVTLGGFLGGAKSVPSLSVLSRQWDSNGTGQSRDTKPTWILQVRGLTIYFSAIGGPKQKSCRPTICILSVVEITSRAS